MSRIMKYLNLTDTDIDEVVTNFEIVIATADSTVFQEYLNQYHQDDLELRGYDVVELVDFCTHIYKFISKKRDKLRVKSDLKLNTDNLFSLIFQENKINLTQDLRFQISILFEYCFSKHEIYDHLDNMEENYRGMYTKYLADYDLNNVQTTY